jgi:hypothetical protein
MGYWRRARRRRWRAGQGSHDANANAVAIQHIKLENEGWERDIAVTEPTEEDTQND